MKVLNMLWSNLRQGDVQFSKVPADSPIQHGLIAFECCFGYRGLCLYQPFLKVVGKQHLRMGITFALDQLSGPFLGLPTLLFFLLLFVFQPNLVKGFFSFSVAGSRYRQSGGNPFGFSFSVYFDIKDSIKSIVFFL